jgi:hypothetical protein
MDASLKIMQMELDPEHKHFAKVLGVQQSIISSVLTTTARVASGRLRGKENDHLAEIIADVRKARDDATKH